MHHPGSNRYRVKEGIEPGISIQLDALKEEYVRNIILVGNVDR